MKTAIVTDSTAYIPPQQAKDKGIHVVPLQITFGNKAYPETELVVEEFYEKAREELPKTSQPPIGEFIALYEKLALQYDEVVAIHLSSGISGTFAGSVQAGELVDGLDVQVFDSEIACAVQGFYALKAADLAAQGMDAKGILAALAEMKQSLRAYFMVEDLRHLQRGGRLSGAQALVGSMLQIKPLLHFQDKLIVPYEKIRTRKKAMNRIAEELKKDYGNEPLQATVIHANRLDEAKKWKAQLESAFPDVEFTISHFGPVIGTHLGEGAMGLGWAKK